MAVTPVKIGGAGSTTSAQSSITAALTVGASVGDVVVFIANIGSGKLGVTPTDTKSNTWNLLAQPASGTTCDCNVWYSVLTTALTTSDTITTSWTGNVARRSWTVLKVTGLAASPLDVVSSNTAAAATTVSLTTGTLAQADELVLACLGWDETASTTNSTMNTDTGWTLLDQELAGGGGTNQIGCGVEYQETSATTSVSVSPSMNETCAGIAGVIVAFKVASSAINLTATDALTSFGGSASMTVTIAATATDALTAFRGSATATVAVTATATDALTAFRGSAVMTSGTFLTATDALTAFRGSASATLTVNMTATGATAFGGSAATANAATPGWGFEVGWDDGAGLFIIGQSVLAGSSSAPAPTMLASAGGQSSVGSSVTATLTTGAPTGSLIVAFFTWAAASAKPASTTVTDSKGNTYTVYPNIGVNPSHAIAVATLTTALAAGDTIVLALQARGGGAASVGARMYSVASYGTGMALNAVDQLSVGNGTAPGDTTITMSTGTLGQAVERALLFISLDEGGGGAFVSGTTVFPPSGWLSRDSESSTGLPQKEFQWADIGVTSSAPITASSVTSGMVNGVVWAATLITLRVAAASFTGDVLAGPYSDPTWSVVNEVQSVRIQRGRQDSVSDVQAGELDVTIVDTAQTYNPKNSSSPLFGRLKPRRFARLTYGWDLGGGNIETLYLFRGYIREITGPQSRQSPYATLVCIDVLEEMSVLKPVVVSTGPTTTGGAINAILNQIQYPAALRSLAVGDPLPDFSADGSTDALTLIGNLLAAELGEFFIAADGTATYVDHGGQQVRAATISSTNILAPGVSLETVVTQATVTRTAPDGTQLGDPQTYQDAQAVQDYNVRVPSSDPLSTPYVSTDQQALDLATRMVSLWKDPRSPIWTLQLNMRPSDPATYLQMLSRDLGDRVAINDPATGGGGDYTIEGIQHQVDTAALNHVTTWALLERPTGTFIIGTSLIGSLDTLAV